MSCVIILFQGVRETSLVEALRCLWHILVTCFAYDLYYEMFLNKLI